MTNAPARTAGEDTDDMDTRVRFRTMTRVVWVTKTGAMRLSMALVRHVRKPPITATAAKTRRCFGQHRNTSRV